MLRIHKAAALLALTALALAASSQAHAQRRGFGLGRYGGGLRPVQLARIEQIQEELQLTADQRQEIQVINDDLRDALRDLFQQGTDRAAARTQVQQLNQEAETKLHGVLDDSQQKRLQQLWIQISGPAVLDDAQIAAALKLTDPQKQQLEEIDASSREAQRALFREADGASREERMAKMQEILDSSNEKRLAVLTDEQRAQFDQMKGEPFEFDRSQLFRGGRAGRRGAQDDNGA